MRPSETGDNATDGSAGPEPTGRSPSLLDARYGVLYGALGFKVQSLEPAAKSDRRGVDTPLVGGHAPLPKARTGT
jgi:hypothetical protein